MTRRSPHATPPDRSEARPADAEDMAPRVAALLVILLLILPLLVPS